MIHALTSQWKVMPYRDGSILERVEHVLTVGRLYLTRIGSYEEVARVNFIFSRGRCGLASSRYASELIFNLNFYLQVEV